MKQPPTIKLPSWEELGFTKAQAKRIHEAFEEYRKEVLTEQSRLEGELEATKYHLEDLRKMLVVPGTESWLCQQRARIVLRNKNS